MNIAVLLATYNRREKTISCLNSLYKQVLPIGSKIEVFLTDDASPDRTAEIIKKNFPAVHVFYGDGSLFWAGGMRRSWQEAIKGTHDYYLLINDDTTLESGALLKLLSYYEKEHPVAICIGSTSNGSKISYGGRKLYNQKAVQSFSIYSTNEFLECDMANANIMLVPQKVVKKIGILSDCYTHSIADFDYTLRANKAGFKVVVAPGVLGQCIDDHGNNWKSAAVSLTERISYLKSPKGLAYKEYLHFIRIHFPHHLPMAFLKLWIKTLFPVLWDKYKTVEN